MDNLLKENIMETANLTPEKSLEIISGIIQKSRKDFERNSGTPMIVWGTTVTVVSAAVQYLLSTTGNAYWNLLWFAIPAIGYPAAYLVCGKKAEKRARNFLDDVIGYVWGCFGAMSVLIAVLGCCFFDGLVGHLTQMIVLLLGFCTALTGLFIKNSMITVAGFLTGVAGCVVSTVIDPIFLPLLMGGASVIALLLPGTILNMKKK